MPLSRLESVAPDVLRHIANYVVVEDTFVTGPPTNLVPVLLISRTIYDAISPRHNFQLLAEIFHDKFDYSAVVRRLSPRWTNTRCLSAELIKRFQAFARIKRGDSTHMDDLWTAYLIMLENDGKNERQLIEWARVDEYLPIIISYRAAATPWTEDCWFTETEGTSLAVWLLWMTSTPHGVLSENSALSRFYRSHLHGFVATGYRYPSIFAPDSHFPLPLCECVEATAPCYSGPSPKVRTITHYSHPLTIAAPPLTPAALLALTVRVEAVFRGSHFRPSDTHTVPPDRATANALGHTGFTLEDIEEFEDRTRTPFLDRNPVDDDDDDYRLSMRHDEDWSRQVSCHDPWMEDMPLRGKVYTPGALTGTWAGRILMPQIDTYWDLALGASPVNVTIPIHPRGIYCRLQEHHCLRPDVPLSPGIDKFGVGDDILNAWFPEGATVEQLEDAIQVFDPTSERQIRYETYYPDRPAPYSKAACDRLQASWVTIRDDEESAEDGLDSGSVDDEDEWSDVVELESSGVADILVTGETTELHRNAWGHYIYLGRVRPWDGLVVLLRTPKVATERHLGRWIFRGYIHDRNFVGRWRETGTSTNMVGLEGGFVMYRTGDA